MRKRPVTDRASLSELRRRQEFFPGLESFPYGEELRSVMASPVYTCPPDASVTQVVGEMSRRGISCVVVVDEGGRPVGIMTERDVMRKVVVDSGSDTAGARVSEVMTPEPVTLKPADSIYRALSVLSSRGIKHLPLAAGGRLEGIVTLRQLTRLKYPEPMVLIEGIGSASDMEGLKRIKARIPELAATRLNSGFRGADIVAMISLINQDLHRRAFELSLRRLGPPPTRCCLFLTGSHGRLENLLTADQDHGLIIEDAEDGSARHGEYFMELARTYSEWLEHIGFAACPGYVMSVNPTWRKSLSEWKMQMGYWVERQVLNLARYVTVFFDSVPVYGEEGLFEDLLEYAWGLLSEHHEVLRVLHEEEGGHRAPVGFWGRFLTERRGVHRGQLDIKKSGIIFFVEGARLLALRHGVRETSTLKRISALVREGHIHHDDGQYFENSFMYLLHLALGAQVSKALTGTVPDTYISPKLLSPPDKEMLKHSFRAISSLQEIIAAEFGELVL